ncbi:MAG: glycoside hydrolase family 3 N-terminal domain-containing protein [Bacteroidia bacterium]
MPGFRKYFFYLLLPAVISGCKPELVSAGEPNVLKEQTSLRPPFIDYLHTGWVDSVMNSMSYEEKIGQLFMVAAYSNRNKAHADSILQLVNKNHIGGLIFFQGGPVRQANLTNLYQSKAKVPLMIAMDAEWGLAMRLDSTMRFPRQMTLGAINEDSLIYFMGREIARQSKRLGVHVNFAPVADINNNPLNPVISNRSFGEDKYEVTKRALLYMKGMQDNGLLANAKHFPGHGDTDTDSHKALPIINKSALGMDSLELYPFKKMISQGLGSMMVAHLFIPAYDTTTNKATTLSKAVVDSLLKKQMGFEGLIFTDALNMKGVSAFHKPGEVDLMALMAGNDVLLFPEDVPAAITRIHIAIQNCEINQADIDERVRKILAVKYWSGLNNYKPINTVNLYNDLNTPQAQYLNQRLYEEAMTIVTNNNDLLPLKELQKRSIASLVIGDTMNNVFQQTLSYYAPVDVYNMQRNAGPEIVNALRGLLNGYNTIIVSVHNTTINASKNYNITEQINTLLGSLSDNADVILVMFGNAYTLSKVTAIDKADAVILAYEDTELPQRIASQIVFGGIGSKGRMPVSPTVSIPFASGIDTESGYRLKYTMPEDVGLNSVDLAMIDTIVKRGIASGAMPGAQVLVAKDGKVIYNKAFGHHTYDKKQKVTTTDLYDVASVTKVAATALASMKLYDENKIDPDKKVSKYLSELKKTDKKDVILKDVMLHRAGYQSWIPFWTQTMKNGKLDTLLYRTSVNDSFNISVAQNLYLRTGYRDSIWNQIVNNPLTNSGKMVYSDLSMITMQMVIEEEAKTSLDDYVNQNFYNPLGLSRITYNPLLKNKVEKIVPTENDTKFRGQLIQGVVHDPAAAMMGGVAGHAGLFSNATDLAVIMQMLINGGNYGGENYIKTSTVNEFTKTHVQGNRRGLIFDKPEPDLSKGGPTAKSAPLTSFGHQGFTGTCVWADPENNLVYIFLSNRVYPDAENNKLAKMNIRTDIHQVIYNAIDQSMERHILGYNE